MRAGRRIMQTPVEIDFQGMSGTPEVHASIEKHVAELEQRYGRVTACRVVLKGPGGHHRTGGLYEVNIFHDFHCPAGVWLGCPVHQVSYSPSPKATAAASSAKSIPPRSSVFLLFLIT